jgi:hypothetical protein
MIYLEFFWVRDAVPETAPDPRAVGFGPVISGFGPDLSLGGSSDLAV